MIEGFDVIDVHMHTYPQASIGIGAQGGNPAHGLTGVLDEIVPLMKEGGIDRGVMLNVSPLGDMFDAIWSRSGYGDDSSGKDEKCQAVNAELVARLVRRNEWTVQVARDNPNLIPFVCIDPRMGVDAMIEELDAKVRDGAHGLKLHPPAQRFYPGDRRMWPVYDWAQERDLPVVLHSGKFNPGGEWPEYAQPRLFVDLLRDFPRLRVVLAHLGGGWWDQTVELAQTFPHVNFDSSIAFSVTPSFNRDVMSDDEVVGIIRAVGADRIMFGSEYPWLHPVLDATRLSRLSLSAGEKRLVLAENAKRVYKL